ncbi:MAG: class I SAM-dependent methyltransferase [Candidatus Omnitrophota bacterium]
MTQIENTGERILLEKETPLMIARHLSAYKFAGGYLGGRTVLDIGCGEGYGSFYLADVASQVKALDYSSEAIDYAAGKYRKDNLQFMVMDVKNLSNLSRKFSAVCSFQFIEHLADASQFLKDITNLLEDDGSFICSTPNKVDASKGKDTPFNRFHLKEYFYAEFKELLEKYFSKVEIFCLKRSPRLSFYRRLKKSGIFNCLPEGLNPVKRFYKRMDCNNFVVSKDNPDTALDFIALCGK